MPEELNAIDQPIFTMPARLLDFRKYVTYFFNRSSCWD
jgi:hypothetical protein